MEMNWSADLRNDELFYVTAQDSRLCVPPHRGSDSQRAYNPEIQSVFPWFYSSRFKNASSSAPSRVIPAAS